MLRYAPGMLSTLLHKLIERVLHIALQQRRQMPSGLLTYALYL